MSLTVYINGKKEELKEPMTVSRLLELKHIRPEVVTVELNERIIARTEYQETALKAGDRLEFVYYMGGGNAN